MSKINIVILAAGEGKRMKSIHSKVTHKILGKPIVRWVYDSFKDVEINKAIVIVGHKSEEVIEVLGNEQFIYVEQKQQLGTGHAVMQATPILEGEEGITLVYCGDVPMISNETTKKVIDFHLKSNNSATVITANFENPFNYGRMVKDDKGNLIKIVEEKDTTEEQKKIKEINSGLYCFNNKDLISSLNKINNNNAQNEYYLTDTIEILINECKKVGTYVIEDYTEILGINNRVQLSEASEILRKKYIKYHMLNGVTIISPDTINIEADVEIGKDTIIYPNTMLKGNTKIGESCEIGPMTTITDSTLGDNTKIINSVILESIVGNNVKIGPFSHIRPNSEIKDKVKIGNFVEVKNSVLDEETKVGHLTYVGDCDVGKDVNFGCGTVIVNYDGKDKFRSKIGDRVMLGCNSNIVSPININDGAYIAAGSTITQEVPKGNLAIARARQVNKENWESKYKK